MKITVIFYCLTLVLCQEYGFAQSQNPALKNKLNFKHLSVAEGLSQRSVTTILQDKKGYLWFGTRDGLNKYDGTNFVTYSYNSEDPNSLSHSWVTSLFEDALGNLWVGTRNGLNKYIPKTNSFKHVYFSSFDDNQITAICQVSDSMLWVATTKTIKTIEIATILETFTKNNYDVLNFDFDDTRVNYFLKASNGDLWIATSKNIYALNFQKKTTNRFSYPTQNDLTINSEKTPCFYEDKDHTIWLGYTKGLAVFNKKTKEFSDFSLENGTTINSVIRSVCQDSSGTLWIGAYTGLYLLDLKNQTLDHITHYDSNSKSLSQNSIYKIIRDTRGDIWIGTWAGGVNYFNKNYNSFKQFFVGEHKSMLNYKVVSAIVEDASENFWIGTEGGGLNYFNSATGEFSYYKNKPSDANSISSNNVKSILRTSAGNLWIGTHDKGLNFFNTQNYTFNNFNNYLVDGNTPISNYSISSLYEDKNKNIWIGTLAGGLLFYDIKTQAFSKIISVVAINCLVPCKDTNFLLFGGVNGLIKIDITSKKTKEIHFVKNTQNYDPRKFVNTVYVDPKNNYWIGTGGNGLFYYNTSNGVSIKYGIDDGLPNETIYGILPDNYNCLWLSTNQGLSRFNLEDYKIKNYNLLDGLQSNEFNYGAYLKASDGKLMFGGVNGLNYFDPSKIKKNIFVPLVDIYSVVINNKEQLNITKANTTLRLAHDQNNFSIRFTAISYLQSSKNMFSYKLDGYDTEWTLAKGNSATYTNIDKGNYFFRVKAANNDGVWTEEARTISIKIIAAPWKTWWAKSLYIIFFLALFFMVLKLGIERLKAKSELKQERINKLKIQEINKLKLELFTNISHEFRTPLTLITGPLQRLVEKKQAGTHIQKQLEGMYKNSLILLQLINQLLDFRKSEAGKLEIHVGQNNIVPFVNNIKESFDLFAEEKKIEFTFKSSKNLINVWFDSLELSKVIVNILSNAFKFTPIGGTITVRVEINNSEKEYNSGKKVVLIIEDNGKGIPEKDIEFIFDRFFQLGSIEKKRVGTGVGLSLSKDIVELHHGSIKVRSRNGSGVIFKVVLPLGNAHFSAKEMIQGVDSIDMGTLNYLNLSTIETKETDILFCEDLPSILLVEDNQELRRFIKNIFEDTCNIFEAENGITGIETAENNPIDLIISDVMMPIIDGVEMCAILKSNIKTSHIPIILLTGKTSTEARELGYKTGADIYISKPFDTKMLELQVKNLFQLRKNTIQKYKTDLILSPKELHITSTDEKFLKKAFDIVNKHSANPDFNAQLFTLKMGVSRTLLYTKLKALTSQSLTEFIRNVRLKKAAQMIVQTDLNISEIAYDLGFNDLKYFRKNFKLLFKMPPSEYRKTSKQ